MALTLYCTVETLRPPNVIYNDKNDKLVNKQNFTNWFLNILPTLKAWLMSTSSLWSVCMHARISRSCDWLNDFLKGYRATISFLAPNNSQVTLCPGWSSLIWSVHLPKPSFTGANHYNQAPTSSPNTISTQPLRARSGFTAVVLRKRRV